MAAALTDLRVGTWVYASPARPPWATAWEAHSLTVLTEGRFEMGIGTGRPGIADQLRELGDTPGPAGGRLDEIRAVITSLRQLDGADRHTPVAMAVRGPKAQALAAEVADIVTFVSPPGDTRAEFEQAIRDFRPEREVERALHVSVVGDGVAPYMAGPDTDPAAMHAARSLGALPAEPSAAAEEILRRRDEFGFTYFVVGARFADILAPVVSELAGVSADATGTGGRSGIRQLR
jgi:alkanesulfonate monooxygenase SsuD/methylene tetrahydromethanopterin reductase-like flavin-dependent oxidoreductase (luciferase family)